jgi:hypothetical protein
MAVGDDYVRQGDNLDWVSRANLGNEISGRAVQMGTALVKRIDAADRALVPTETPGA